jgi:hypothetical protein
VARYGFYASLSERADGWDAKLEAELEAEWTKRVNARRADPPDREPAAV